MNLFTFFLKRNGKLLEMLNVTKDYILLSATGKCKMLYDLELSGRRHPVDITS